MNTTPMNNTTYATQPAGVTGAGTTYPAAPANDHTKRDTLLGAGAGAATGHTVLGGLAGHAVGKHERHANAAGGAPAGTVPAGHSHPSTLDKIEGAIESGVGKLTHNPAMVAQGQAKKAAGTVPATGVQSGTGAGGMGTY